MTEASIGGSTATRRAPSAFGTDLMLLGVAGLWGMSYALAKQATQHLPVLQFLALRFGLTFVVLLPALKPLFGPAWRQGLAVGGALGANLLAIFLCETFGVSLTSAANAAFLISLCVAITPFAEWWLIGRRPRSRMFVAASASALGAALLSATSAANIATGWGDALMLAAAVLRAVMVCLTKRLAAHHKLPALTLTALQSGVVAVGASLLCCAAPTRRVVAWPTDLGFWWAIGFLVVFCTVFAFFAQNHAASRTSPSRVSLMMGCEPLFGALFATAWLGESVPPIGWLGGGLIVASAWWVTAPSRSRS